MKTSVHTDMNPHGLDLPALVSMTAALWATDALQSGEFEHHVSTTTTTAPVSASRCTSSRFNPGQPSRSCSEASVQ